MHGRKQRIVEVLLYFSNYCQEQITMINVFQRRRKLPKKANQIGAVRMGYMMEIPTCQTSEEITQILQL